MISPIECLLCGCVFDLAEAVVGARIEPNSRIESNKVEDVWVECPECKARVTTEERFTGKLILP